MGGMCARVCPTEVLCEEACVRNVHEEKPVDIGLLQRHATAWQIAWATAKREEPLTVPKGKELEFLPAVLEVQASPPSPAGRAGSGPRGIGGGRPRSGYGQPPKWSG